MTKMNTVIERHVQQRDWIETHELRRDAWLDLLGVHGSVVCPLIPGGLSAVSMINVFPTLLHIPVWAAIVIALITVAGVEILTLLATERPIVALPSQNETQPRDPELMAIESQLRIAVKDALHHKSRKPFHWAGLVGYQQLEAAADALATVPQDDPGTAYLHRIASPVTRAVAKNHTLANDLKQAHQQRQRIADCLRYPSARPDTNSADHDLRHPTSMPISNTVNGWLRPKNLANFYIAYIVVLRIPSISCLHNTTIDVKNSYTLTALMFRIIRLRITLNRRRISSFLPLEILNAHYRPLSAHGSRCRLPSMTYLRLYLPDLDPILTVFSLLHTT